MTKRAANKAKATKKTMWECKVTLTTAAEGSEEWHWARIGYNECARELGLPDFAA